MPTKQRNTDELRAWFQRVEPIYPELYNAAMAMCGNDELAQYALRSAILEVWSQGGGGMGLQERLRSAVRDEAFYLALSDEGRAADQNWPGLPAMDPEDPIWALALQESADNQRLLMLRFGCGIGPRSLARLLDLDAEQVRAAQDRFVARCRRAVAVNDRSRAESLAAQRFRRALKRPAGRPGPARLYRVVESEAVRSQTSGRLVTRWLKRGLALGLALFCALAFWLFAVLVRPEPKPEIVAEATEQAVEAP